MDTRTFGTQMSDLALELASQPDLQSTLSAACAASLGPVGADGAGIFVVERGKVVTAAVAGPGMVEAELVHLELDEGPCLSAISEREPILITTMTEDPRWPAWTEFMAARGWSSALAVRLIDASNATLGSLNLFSQTPDNFDWDDAEVVGIFGGVISAALIGSRTQEQLHQAIASRHCVGVAQGILMQRYDLPGVEASFEVLRRYSQDHNIKLARLAAWVMEHRTLPDSPIH